MTGAKNKIVDVAGNPLGETRYCGDLYEAIVTVMSTRKIFLVWNSDIELFKIFIEASLSLPSTFHYPIFFFY